MKKINYVIVGLGRSGINIHLKNLLKLKFYNCLGVYDINKKKTERIKKNFKLFSYKSIDEILRNNLVDIVILSTPSCTHFKLAKKILKKKSIVIEKPLVSSSKELNIILNLKKNNNNKIYPFYNFRFNRDANIIKSIIKKGTIGKILSIKKNIRSFNIREDWQSKTTDMGGIINAQGIHHIDQVFNVLLSEYKNKPKINYVENFNFVSKGDAEDYSNIIFELNKISVNVELSWADASDLPHSEWKVFGDRGTLWSKNNKIYVKYFKKKIINNIVNKNNLYLPKRVPLWKRIIYSIPLNSIYSGSTKDFYKELFIAYKKKENFIIEDSQLIKIQYIMDRIKNFRKKR
jgi:scyllo-inositol 2-dehydrogenase (NADP+)